MVEYYSYLRSDNWKAKRQESIKEHKSCKICKNHYNNYDIHHLTYDRLGDENKKDIIPLCKKCHLLFHRLNKKLNISLNNRPQNRNLLESLKRTRNFDNEIDRFIYCENRLKVVQLRQFFEMYYFYNKVLNIKNADNYIRKTHILRKKFQTDV